MNPKVSFIVPCYKLAHLLGECVASILSQTFTDFEVLIMDDCSPDNTAEVVAAFDDPRIRYIRNDPNLGHLRNYNKGIELSRGEYVWLISADDRIRNTTALEKYMRVMQAQPKVGFVCCPAMELKDGRETALAKYSVLADHDIIYGGHQFLKNLLYSDTVIASSGMVRRVCYEKLGSFPLDLPYAGDWYMWCLFALHYDVAYIAEPMVSYRGHELSMTTTLIAKDIQILANDSLAVLWRIKHLAERLGDKGVASKFGMALAYHYALYIRGENYPKIQMTLPEVQESVEKNANSAREARLIRARVHASLGDRLFQVRKFEAARQAYTCALQEDTFLFKTRVKRLLLRTGLLGTRARIARQRLRSVRESSLVEKVQQRQAADRIEA